MKKILLLVCIFIIGLVSVLINKPVIETDILKSISNNQILIDINQHLNSDIVVIFKSGSIQDFCDKIKNKNLGQIVSINDYKYTELIQSHPKNFLTFETRKLIKEKNYQEVANKGMNRLYNPMNVPLVSLDKDPYLFVNEYFLSDFKLSDYSVVKIKTDCIGEVITLAKDYDVYLAGSPVHAYKTAQKSAFQINVFCILATIFIILLCKYIFGSSKVFIPIILSILFGYITGYIATSLIFGTLHVITLVFATTLIGVGVDYSLHYYSNIVHDKEFYKNLTTSMGTTILAFSLLLIPDITLLNQIAVYTISGLFAVYLFVIIVYPNLNIKGGNVRKNIKLLNIKREWFILVVSMLILIGLMQIRIDDTPENLYNPDKDLKQAEIINQQISNPENKEISIIVVDSFEEEELICDILNENNVQNISSTKFIPTTKRQIENINLVNELYKNNLDEYGNFLTDGQKNNLIQKYNETFDYEMASFKLNNDKKIIIAYNLNSEILKPLNNIICLNIQKEISKDLKKCRKNIQPLIPLLFVGMFIVLYSIYKNRAYKILFPSMVGVGVSLAVSLLLGNGINIFSILTIFLIIGFTIDYSIFKSTQNRNSDIAVMAACLSTVFSFFLLSFASFKLISTIGTMLFIGIGTSYLASCILFDNSKPDKIN